MMTIFISSVPSSATKLCQLVDHLSVCNVLDAGDDIAAALLALRKGSWGRQYLKQSCHNTSESVLRVPTSRLALVLSPHIYRCPVQLQPECRPGPHPHSRQAHSRIYSFLIANHTSCLQQVCGQCCPCMKNKKVACHKAHSLQCSYGGRTRTNHK